MLLLGSTATVAPNAPLPAGPEMSTCSAATGNTKNNTPQTSNQERSHKSPYYERR